MRFDWCSSSDAVKDITGSALGPIFLAVVSVFSIKSVATAWFGSVACRLHLLIFLLSVRRLDAFVNWRLRHRAATAVVVVVVDKAACRSPWASRSSGGPSVGPSSESSSTVDRQIIIEHRAAETSLSRCAMDDDEWVSPARSPASSVESLWHDGRPACWPSAGESWLSGSKGERYFAGRCVSPLQSHPSRRRLRSRRIDDAPLLDLSRFRASRHFLVENSILL